MGRGRRLPAGVGSEIRSAVVRCHRDATCGNGIVAMEAGGAWMEPSGACSCSRSQRMPDRRCRSQVNALSKAVFRIVAL